MNKIRFLTPTIHSVLDYAAAAGLILFPFVLGFDGTALWLSVAGGAGLVIYSLLTDYAFGAIAVFSFKTHLALDLTAAAAFVAAPFIFDWTGLVMGYYFVMAAGVVIVVALTNPGTELEESFAYSADA